MRLTRVYSGKWVFDGAEYHRAGVDEIQSVEAVRFYPRVDIRHQGHDDAISTYRTDPGHAGFDSLTEARNYAETARAEWESGKRSLYRIREVEEEPLSWPKARDEEFRNQRQAGQLQITVGSLVTVKPGAEISSPGEAGVCFATQRLGDVDWESKPPQPERLEGPGFSFIFQDGGFVGLTAAEVNKYLEVSGSVSPHAADYKFTNAGQLGIDYGSGRFDAAFEEQNIKNVAERCFTPHPRDILRREYDENLRREAAGIEPKRGMDVDFDSGRD